MACNNPHTETDEIITKLPIDQSGFGRHKCASCAYEQGLKDGENKKLNYNLENFISKLPESQEGLRRHRSPTLAYELGFFHSSDVDNKKIIKNYHKIIQEKDKISAQMSHFGLYMIARGLLNATLLDSEIKRNFYNHPMGLVQVANGFEILVKSKIVEEHPLLVFSKIPKEGNLRDGNIKFEDLIEHGQTIMYSELPERLWQTTGYNIKPIELFNEFGKVRNQIIHFAVPERSLSDLTYRFTFDIVEKAINEWLDKTILEYACEFDPNYFSKAVEDLRKLKIKLNYELDKDGKSKKK